MLACLASPAPIVRKQVANAIAGIASIEVPRKEWLDLLPLLCGNSEHSQIEIRHAALETLGFICEEVDPNDMPNEYKSLIVQALIKNIIIEPQFEQTTLLAVKAFFLALPYAEQNFKVAHERDFIMEKLFSSFQA